MRERERKKGNKEQKGKKNFNNYQILFSDNLTVSES